MKQKGFTLIELLVVVAIIGILSSIGIVKYNDYTLAAKRTATNKICKMVINEVKTTTINLLCRIDTQRELEYFKAGGILKYVLNSIEKNIT